MSIYLEFFDIYACRGLMPIAIEKGTKKPPVLNFNKNWRKNYWRNFFLKENNDYELGLLWNNGMIDIETDDQKSREYLEKLIGDVPRPIYKSLRSHHNIFISPNKKLSKTVLRIKKNIKIEVFGIKSFTVAPPSLHQSGQVRYEFINDIWPPPPCPSSIKSLCFQKKSCLKNNKEYIESLCNICNQKTILHKKRLPREVKAFRKLKELWMCKKCRKEKGLDINPIVRLIKKQEC